MRVLTNQKPDSDYIGNAFNDMKSGETVYFATAFFTELKELEKVLEQCGKLNLIVRLGFPTSAERLLELMNGKYKNKVSIRYYASSYFHPKLYIFGNRKAIVGSANFTNNALWSNQEVCIELNNNEETTEGEAFFELQRTFKSYWEEAKPVTEGILKEYNSFILKYPSIEKEIYELDEKFPDHLIHKFENNASLKKDKKTKKAMFFDELRPLQKP